MVILVIAGGVAVVLSIVLAVANIAVHWHHHTDPEDGLPLGELIDLSDVHFDWPTHMEEL